MENLILTDLNIDCIEKIFDNLELGDLVNIADANKCLKMCAEMIFVRNYGNKCIMLDLEPNSLLPSISMQKEWTKISDLKTCLQTMRCFGHLITNLHVKDYHSNDGKIPQIIWLLNYITEYCRKNVIEITFEKFSDVTLSEIQMEFLKLKTLHFRYCNIEQNLGNFNQIFPEVNKLELTWTNVSDIYDNIVNLESLDINIPITIGELEKNWIKKIIKSNKRMIKCKLYFRWDIQFLIEISKYLNYVENLEIGPLYSNSTELNRNVIHLDGVKKFKLHTNGMDPDPNIIFSFNGIEDYTLETICWWNEKNIQLINKYSNITKLIIISANQIFPAIISQNIAIKLSKTLTFLREIVIYYKQFTVNEIMFFLNYFDLLQKISFDLTKCEEFDGLMLRVGGKWTANIDGNRVQMEKNSGRKNGKLTK